MFFILSKIFWFIARPLNLLFFAALAAAVLGRLGWRRTARAALIAVALTFACVGFTQLPDWLIHRLESAVEPANLPADPAGIIVLGGGISANAQTDLADYHLGESGDRILRALELKRLYPAARLIYSGGLASIAEIGTPSAYAAQALVRALYGEDLGMELEARSRNTWQNAEYVAAMAGPDRDRKFLLVTSGYHMPRALGAFRQAGLQVAPVPTDFRADPIRFPYITGASSYQFLKFSLFVKEIIGLVAYRLTNRSNSLFPGRP